MSERSRSQRRPCANGRRPCANDVRRRGGQRSNENPKALRAGRGAAVQYEITVRLARQRHPALRAPRWHARPAAAATLDARGLKRRVEDAHAFLMLLSRRARARPVPPPSVSCFTRHTGARPRAPLGPHARYPVSPSARPASVCIAWSLRTQCWSREGGVLRTIKDIPSQPIAAGCRPACRAARAATHAGTKHTRAYMGAIARSHLELGWW